MKVKWNGTTSYQRCICKVGDPHAACTNGKCQEMNMISDADLATRAADNQSLGAVANHELVLEELRTCYAAEGVEFDERDVWGEEIYMIIKNLKAPDIAERDQKIRDEVLQDHINILESLGWLPGHDRDTIIEALKGGPK